MGLRNTILQYNTLSMMCILVTGLQWRPQGGTQNKQRASVRLYWLSSPLTACRPPKYPVSASVQSTNSTKVFDALLPSSIVGLLCLVFSWLSYALYCVYSFLFQDYPEAMEASRDNHRYIQWNLEATAQLMAARFPDSHVWLIHPKEMHFKTFSVYSNFLEFTDFTANPIYSKDHNCWMHLKAILSSACKRLSEGDTCAAENSENVDTCEEKHNSLPSIASPELPLTVIGFSKGCVVLNQLLYELETAKSKLELSGILGNVQAFYLLDSGHNGGKDIFITQDDVLQHLQDMGIHIHVHVTPYQIKDITRPYIKAEYKRFIEKLHKLKVPVTNIRHFEDEERNIEAHFEVLKVFKE